jgi:hypothetical protein
MGTVQAEDDKAAERVAWFHGISDARKVATQTGRPLFVAIHVRPGVASPEATQRLERWIQVYADPGLVALSREFACVLRVIQAPEGKDPDRDTGPAAVHLVVDGTSRVLARLDLDAPASGAEGVRRLTRILQGGLENFGALPTGAPQISPAMVARTKVDLSGISPSKPVGVPHGVPGVRLRLRWELPAPKLEGAASDRIRAAVRMRWDGAGPFDLGAIEFGAGEDIDEPIDVRFDAIEGLAELATKGTHRVDLYLVPLPGSYPFSQGPLHVGRVWIDLGEGGGGGGASSDNEKEQPEDPPPQPQPQPDEGEQPLPPPPPPEREEVVQPFVNEGETVKKEDAVVAVKDPDGGVKPPKQVPLEEALRDFEKRKESEVARETIPASERAFLRRYFEQLERAVKGKVGK